MPTNPAEDLWNGVCPLLTPTYTHGHTHTDYNYAQTTHTHMAHAPVQTSEPNEGPSERLPMAAVPSPPAYLGGLQPAQASLGSLSPHDAYAYDGGGWRGGGRRYAGGEEYGPHYKRPIATRDS